MDVYAFKRLTMFKEPNSMGLVRDAKYVNCYWPIPDEPTEIFAPGSSGIIVQGRPGPRNIIFPDDTVFLDYYPDALFPAEVAVRTAFPDLKQMVNLTPEQTQVYLDAYENEVLKFPVTHTVLPTKNDVFFLRHQNEKETGLIEGKDTSIPNVLIAPLTKEDAVLIAKGDEAFYKTFISKAETVFYSSREDIKEGSQKYTVAFSDSKYQPSEKQP